MKVTGYVYLAASLFGQAYAAGQISMFSGHLVEGNYRSYDGFVVEITNLQNRTIRQRVDVRSDGGFEFRAIPDGDYEVHVTTLEGMEIANTVTTVSPSASILDIRMPGNLVPGSQQRPPSGTVTIQQLNHPLSRHVRKLLENGHKALQDRDYGAAAEQFRQAIKDDPRCPQAHANLGLSLSKLGSWEAASGEFRKSIELDPDNPMLHANLSAALATLRRFDEAQDEASVALKLDRHNARAHYVMAGVLLQKHAPLSEVAPHLQAAQDVFPSARTALQKLCAATAQPRQAARLTPLPDTPSPPACLAGRS